VSGKVLTGHNAEKLLQALDLYFSNVDINEP